MKKMNDELKKYFGEKDCGTLKNNCPELGWDDATVIEHKEIKDNCCTVIDLWLIEDSDCGDRAIVRADAAGMSAIGVFSSREDQLTFAAWNADFDIRVLEEWIGSEAMDLALEDAAANDWGVNMWSEC